MTRTIQEALLSATAPVVHAVACDRKGCLPTHSACFARPLTGGCGTDFVGRRSKRLFDAPVGRRCGEQRLRFLAQTCRRGAGEVMRDVSTPVMVRGSHRGGDRTGYRA